MSAQPVDRRLFKALGSSPYMLSLLRYIAVASPSFGDLENYFRTIRRLYGWRHGLPSSKIITSNLNTLRSFGLVLKDDKVWRTTAIGNTVISFQEALLKQQKSIYFWIRGSASASERELTEITRFLSENHDFYQLTSVGRAVLLRFNAGYTEVISVNSQQALAGLIYPVSYGRLALAQKKLVDMGDISKKEADIPAFLYVHMISRLRHTIADFDHARANGERKVAPRWSDAVVIIDPMVRVLESYRWRTKRFIQLPEEDLDREFSTLGLMRCIERAIDEPFRMKRDRSLYLSDEVVAIEKKIARVEFSEREDKEMLLNAYGVIQESLLGADVTKKTLDAAKFFVRSA